MCMVVYIASDYPLATWPFDRERPGFHVAELSEHENRVRRHFSKPFVYYAGSHELCGCGFQYGEYEGFEEEADLPAKRESRRRLAEFLSVALQHQPAVEVYACWSEEESAEPEHRGRIRPADLVGGRTFFREKELLVVSEAAEPQRAPDGG